MQKTSSLTTGGSAVKVEAAGDGPKSNQVGSPKWGARKSTQVVLHFIYRGRSIGGMSPPAVKVVWFVYIAHLSSGEG
jgi:hypothetical protein